MTKKDWMWGLFGIFTGFAINLIANNLSPDMIKGLVLGLIFGFIGGMFVSDKYLKTPQKVEPQQPQEDNADKAE